MSFISNFKFQISNLPIKSNLPSILTITLLILTIGILFWYGDKKINEATNVNSTIIAWNNLSNNYPPDKNLNLTIKNITSTKIIYQVNFLLNEKNIDSLEIAIPAQGKSIIEPTKKVVAKLTTLSKNKRNDSTDILYQVKIIWDKNKKAETLGKWLNFK